VPSQYGPSVSKIEALQICPKKQNVDFLQKGFNDIDEFPIIYGEYLHK
jgi:hypothetical protein